ncbi:N-terminal double-transmembrane domain-containing protein [Cognatiyoonia sediminum]|uniref:N-terminal double-transmembrane domain-containing protein n=1 Tax=Cognatiyoonia sediminum TaxID=1508389 RepID=A0A1M5S1B4_9RHOB|nr:DUF4159 domain-containing protein [Cognatiyoonia sediminum]SHH31823.1 N-terminal double-transmembrane domain-containing protein [Cognatiyoonia sediminum]
MWPIGPIGFLSPWLLLGLLALPILWILLRAVPPAPIRRRFPGVALLIGLTDDESQTDRTPWWLLLLRMMAVAAAIIGFAGPVLNPQNQETGDGPLLIIADGTWADARDWNARIERIDALLNDAARQGRPVALLSLTDLPETTLFQSASAVAQTLPNLQPNPWEPAEDALFDWINTLPGDFDTYWLSDGLARKSRDLLLTDFEARGSVTVFQTPRQTFGLRPARFVDGEILVSATRTPIGNDTTIPVVAIGLDPAGVERQLVTVDLDFTAGEPVAERAIVVPPELRNRITRFEIDGVRSAAAISLTDDALKRREVALLSGAGDQEQLDLLDPLFYLREALEPTADLIDGTLSDMLLANPDAIVLADFATLASDETEGLLEWVENGGLLVRFAGPRLAASEIGRSDEDPLLPVRLRQGGRSIGGTMSWGEPKALAPFAETSPFFGLQVPDDVEVTAQVVAQPDPTLASRVIAQLADGTPLVTRKQVGEGSVILFHVTANAEWSSLPLSGLFVQMLERLAISTRPSDIEAGELEGTTWLPEDVLDAFGRLYDGRTLAGVDGSLLENPSPGPELQPGLYSGNDRLIAVNVIDAETALATAQWPNSVTVEGLDVSEETDLKGWFLAAATLLLAIDVIASLAVGGRLRGPRADITAALLALVLLTPQWAEAQEDEFALNATSNVVLGYVLTGDEHTDEISEAGLRGLSRTLFQRTTIEPSAPVGVNIETDELAFFPFLYWPITPDQGLPSREAYGKLNRYLRSGGMILFDTGDADNASFGSSSPEGRTLRAIARTLDIPALEPIPQDHVLTRTFYLLQDFPGRYASRDIWVEAAPADAELAEGMPFRNLNDGVTPVVIGGNDWARAWAIDDVGNRMFPVGRGRTGERQRELAYRFGVNLIMHVLTGNYKSDQVHVPDLLERLGQ